MGACRNYESEIYIPFENAKINWRWTKAEVKKFRKYFKVGYGIKNARLLSRLFERTEEEVLLMLIDCALYDNIAKNATPLQEVNYALESVDIDWFWWRSEVRKVDYLSETGMTYKQIAEAIGRSEADTLILLLDRVIRGKVKAIFKEEI